MAVKTIEIDGSLHAIMPDGDVRKVATYFGMDKEVADKGDGTYAIPAVTDARNPDMFYTKDTQKVFMYEESINAWYKQTKS